MGAWKKIIIKLAISAVAVAALGGAGWLAAAYFSGQIVEISRLIQEERRLSFALENRGKTAQKLEGDFSLVSPDYESKILSALPLIDDISPFSASIASLAQKHGVGYALNFNNPTVPAERGSNLNIVGLDYQLTISNASVSLLSDFLADFEKLPFFNGLSNLSITGADSAGWTGNSNAALNGKIYVRQ